ncbi:IS3 family transposase [Bradyrhizobium sp. 170]|nr:IS3 family transposase [Bradyrhizobium sp. 170]
MESLFHTLKTALVHHRNYKTRAEAQRDIFTFIEGFYHRTRLHSAIGYISPIETELKACLNPSSFAAEDQMRTRNLPRIEVFCHTSASYLCRRGYAATADGAQFAPGQLSTLVIDLDSRSTPIIDQAGRSIER